MHLKIPTFWLLSMAFITLSSAQQLEHPSKKERAPKGGTSSNGGGGDEINKNWHPTPGLGELLFRSPGQSYQEKIESFKKSFPEVKIHSCPGGLSFPSIESLPPEMSVFDIVFRYQKHIIFIPSGLSDEIKISSPDLCDYELALVKAYGSFATTAIAMLKSDRVGNEIVKAIVSSDHLKTRIVITPYPEKVKVKGGTIEEFTWFDHDSGKIYWSPRGAGTAFASLVGRNDSAFLRHELAHVLMWKVLGNRYPKVEHWHDISHNRSEETLFGREWLKHRTSNEAAFIEGIANALERTRFASDHPNIRRKSEINGLHKDEKRKEFYYTWAPDVKTGTQQGGTLDGDFNSPKKFLAPTDSETYVSSAINVFFEGWHPNNDSLKPEINERSGEIYHTVNEDRMIIFIKALTFEAPTNVEELAKAFDRIDQSDFGYRWLREYFYVDYKTGLNTYSEFSLREEPGFFGKGIRQVYFLGIENSDKFLSPFLLEEEEIVRNQAQSIHAGLITREILNSDIEKTISEIENDMQTLFDQLPLEGILNTRRSIAANVITKNNKIDNESMESKYPKYLIKAYQISESRFGTTIPLTDLTEFLLEATLNGEGLKSLAKLKTNLVKANELKAQNSFVGTPEHTQLVRKWISLKHYGLRLGLSSLHQDFVATQAFAAVFDIK